MRNSRHILLIGTDSDLLVTRAMVFASAGFTPIVVRTAEAAKLALTNLSIVGAVFCHTVSEDQRALITADLKQIHPGAGTILLKQGWCDPASILSCARAFDWSGGGEEECVGGELQPARQPVKASKSAEIIPLHFRTAQRF